MRWVSSFKVKQVINSYAYELDLPRVYEVYSVFHVNLMNSVATDPLEGALTRTLITHTNWQREGMADGRDSRCLENQKVP